MSLKSTTDFVFTSAVLRYWEKGLKGLLLLLLLSASSSLLLRARLDKRSGFLDRNLDFEGKVRECADKFIWTRSVRSRFRSLSDPHFLFQQGV